jgi:hypothetical protein
VSPISNYDLHGRFVASPLIDRFWDKVHKTDSCWEFTGKQDYKGYGRIRVDRRTPMAHHVSYYLKTGEWIPFGYEPDHTCKNPSCVRWAHGHLEAIPREEHVRRTALTHPNRVKAHCKRGHSRWAFRPNGSRYCMDCNVLRVKGLI